MATICDNRKIRILQKGEKEKELPRNLKFFACSSKKTIIDFEFLKS
jgi:hypothetical protein